MVTALLELLRTFDGRILEDGVLVDATEASLAAGDAVLLGFISEATVDAPFLGKLGFTDVKILAMVKAAMPELEAYAVLTGR